MINEPLWINGEYSDFALTRIPVEDRGFVFGDGVYEVVRVYNGVPFLMDAHLARLRRSLAGVEISLEMTDVEIERIARELVARSNLMDAEIYMQITRGVERRNHVWDDRIQPTVLLGAKRGRSIPPELYETGCRIIMLPDQRWARCDLKALNLLPNVLAKKRAVRVGALEAVMRRDNLLTEGATSNVFIVSGESIYTPTADHRILCGVTRNATIEVAGRCGFKVCEADVPIEHFENADEIFLTSTSVELMPVTQVDQRTISGGRPGKVYRTLHRAFREFVAEQIAKANVK